MTQVINDKLKQCCRHCESLIDKPCAWLSLGNEYCTEIMEVQKEIERLHSIIKEVREKLCKYGLVDKEGNFNAYLDTIELKELLEILDKENKDE